MPVENLGQVATDTFKVGRWTFNMFNGTSLTGVIDFSADSESDTQEVFQQGGGDLPRVWLAKKKWNGKFRMQAGDLVTLSALAGLTLGASGGYGLPFGTSGSVSGWLERRIYDETFETILFATIFPDIILMDIPDVGDIDRAELDVTFRSYAEPWHLKDHTAETTKEIIGVRDTFDGDDIVKVFTLNHTPLLISNTKLNNGLAFYVKVDGVQQIADYTITPGGPSLTFVTAPPTGTDNIEMLYAYDLNEA